MQSAVSAADAGSYNPEPSFQPVFAILKLWIRRNFDAHICSLITVDMPCSMKNHNMRQLFPGAEHCWTDRSLLPWTNTLVSFTYVGLAINANRKLQCFFSSSYIERNNLQCPQRNAEEYEKQTFVRHACCKPGTGIHPQCCWAQFYFKLEGGQA